MSLDDARTVDVLGIENGTGRPVLTIADDWDWTDEREHLLALQAKLNGYFEFIESGQIWDACPFARGRPVVIDVVPRFPLPASARALLEKAAEVAAQLNPFVRHRHFQGTTGTETV